MLPFGRFHGVDTVLGPEMRSTGEVMGIDALFGTAFAKSQMAAYSGGLPTSGRAFVSVANRDKRSMIFPVKRLADLGFEILATEGTAEVLRRNGVIATVVRKHYEAGRRHPGRRRADPGRRHRPHREHAVRRRRRGSTATRSAPPRSPAGCPCITTVQGLAAAVQGIEALLAGEVGVRSLQEYACGTCARRARRDGASAVSGADAGAGQAARCCRRPPGRATTTR